MNEDNKNLEQHELDKIRMRKMQAMIDAQKRQQAVEKNSTTIWEKIDHVLKIVLNPDAYSHLNKLKENEPPVYQAIFNELISYDVIQNIDYLLAIIQKQGGVPRRIPLDVIILLERKAKGIKSQIKVKQGSDGEMMDLGDFLIKK